MQHDQTNPNPTHDLPNLPTDRRALLAGIGGLAAGAFIAGKANAGPLSPPAGPIAPTPGPEPRIAINSVNTPGDDTSLYKITQPGSYYLTGNIAGVAEKHGIEIAASGVTLDLNGFELVGNLLGFMNGVTVPTVGELSSIAVLNGSVRNWNASGVSVVARNCRVDGVRADGNSGYGIRTGRDAVVSNCSAFGNGGADRYGIFVGEGSVVAHCTAGSNLGVGIVADPGSSITNCTAYGNSSIGIVATSGCTIDGCTVRSNQQDGILVSGGCVVRNNNCSANGSQNSDGANIRTTGSDNRIEGNNCTGADRGIDVDGSGSFIVRNTCSGNTINWAISANNVFGPIVDRRSPNTTAFFGNSAASSLGTTDANANFTY